MTSERCPQVSLQSLLSRAVLLQSYKLQHGNLNHTMTSSAIQPLVTSKHSTIHTHSASTTALNIATPGPTGPTNKGSLKRNNRPVRRVMVHADRRLWYCP
jgi:hypothetical protein